MTFKDFMEAHPDITMLELGWALVWRVWAVIAVLGLTLTLLAAAGSSLG